MSPVFRREEGFVFKIHSNEEDRMHIHVIKAENEAKIWLEPSVEVAWNDEFGSGDLKKILQIVKTNADKFKLQYSLHIGKRINDK